MPRVVLVRLRLLGTISGCVRIFRGRIASSRLSFRSGFVSLLRGLLSRVRGGEGGSFAVVTISVNLAGFRVWGCFCGLLVMSIGGG